MEMKLENLHNKREFLMSSLDSLKNPTLETSGKHQRFFPSNYMTSVVQEPNTYDNCMHTKFINPIHPIRYSDDGLNVIFDFIRNLMEKVSRVWLWILMTQQQMMMSEPKLRRCFIEGLNQQAILQPYDYLCVTIILALTRGKVYIYILDGYNNINQNYVSQDDPYVITLNIPSRCELRWDMVKMCVFRYYIDCTEAKSQDKKCFERLNVSSLIINFPIV